MFKCFFNFINSFFPYKIKGRNNKIYVIFKGRKKELKRKIKGLNIDINGNNNIIKLHFPVYFEDTNIEINGSNSSFEMLSATCYMRSTNFYLEKNAHVYIGSRSRFNTKNISVILDNVPEGKQSKLIIGNDVQVGVGVTIRTSDGHAIYNLGEKIPYNEPKDIIIGDYVWIGGGSTIIKGAELATQTIVGANSVVNKKFTESNIIVAGTPAKIIKRNVRWTHEDYGQAIDRINNEKNLTDTYRMKSLIKQKIKRKILKLKLKMFF